jgi:hypothetical protein
MCRATGNIQRSKRARWCGGGGTSADWFPTCCAGIVVPPAFTNTNELIVCGVDAISSIPKEGGATFLRLASDASDASRVLLDHVVVTELLVCRD